LTVQACYNRERTNGTDWIFGKNMDAAARIPEKEFVIEAQATASKRGMTALGIMLALLATVV
jgi:hypothetical protein